jgi:4-diphosphocytidyl-2-C-methyl-D-erythritol kinase
LILFPNSKINLGLHVADKRADGYHNLETVFFPIPLRDALEITTCSVKKEKTLPFEITITGIPIPGNSSSNLCKKAWELIKKDFPSIPPVRMHLHKAIPIGAGLGGGSSDGAFTLLLLNEELKLNLTTEKLLHYALMLGSDCPFFILNKPCYATGRGEEMADIHLDLKNYYFVIVHPDIHVNTGETFAALAELRKNNGPANHHSSAPGVKKAISAPISTWKENLVNDFEEPVFKMYPLLADIRQMLYNEGAEYASMTGTGSSIFGIFDKSKKSGNLRADERFRVYYLNQSH